MIDCRRDFLYGFDEQMMLLTATGKGTLAS
jgi:hypothetical protein